MWRYVCIAYKENNTYFGYFMQEGEIVEKNKLKVLIDGKEYTVKSEMPVKDIQEVAFCVDSKIGEIRKSECGIGLSTVMVSVLAALNIAEDYVKLRKSNEELSKKYSQLQASDKKTENEIARLKKISEDYEKLQKDFIRAETILKSRGLNLNDKK